MPLKASELRTRSLRIANHKQPTKPSQIRQQVVANQRNFFDLLLHFCCSAFPLAPAGGAPHAVASLVLPAVPWSLFKKTSKWGFLGGLNWLNVWLLVRLRSWCPGHGIQPCIEYHAQQEFCLEIVSILFLCPLFLKSQKNQKQQKSSKFLDMRVIWLSPRWWRGLICWSDWLSPHPYLCVCPEVVQLVEEDDPPW